MSTHDRGFASMDREKQREIASKGGRAAHQKGRAHEWSPAEARAAGRKGGIASHRKRADGEPPPADPQADPPAEPPPGNALDAFSYDW